VLHHLLSINGTRCTYTSCTHSYRQTCTTWKTTPGALHVAGVGHVGDMLLLVCWVEVVYYSLRTWVDIRDAYMSALLLACAALCAAIAAMPEASTGVRADTEPLVAAQGTLIKYAGGPFNTAFISARPGAWHLQAPTWGRTPFVTGFESPATSVVHQRIAMPHTAWRRCRAAQASRSGHPGKALSQA